MSATVVRYQMKPELANDNQELIESVFADLEARQPIGLTYSAYRLEDGVNFIHLMIEHDALSPDLLQTIPAFKAFVANVADRCDVPPTGQAATVIGDYRQPGATHQVNSPT
jgi:hypothetical protein